MKQLGGIETSLISVEKNAFLDWLAAYRTLVHPVSTHLTRAVAAQEYHVLEPIHAHGAARLKKKKKCKKKKPLINWVSPINDQVTFAYEIEIEVEMCGTSDMSKIELKKVLKQFKW
jgi:hypothetical protein